MRNAEVGAERVDELYDGRRQPGSFQSYKNARHDPAGILFWCPCGCGRMGSLRFALPGQSGWEWNGNIDKPSIWPAVTLAEGEVGEWQGVLDAGVWRAS